MMKIINIFLVAILITSTVFARSKNPPDSLGEQRVAVILIDLVEDGAEQSAAEIKEALFSSEYSIDKFVRENSYGRTWLKGDVFGWYKARAIDKCHLTPEQIWNLTNKDIRFKNYDRYIIFFNQISEGCGNVGLGESSFGKLVLKTPQGEVRASYSVVLARDRFGKPVLPYQKLAYITSTVTSHELGHAFGLYGHGNIFDCGPATLAKDSIGCKQSAIADMFSMMGGEGFFRPTLHHTACHKEQLGWFKPNEIKSVQIADLKKGPITVNVQPYEKSNGGYLTTKILLDKPIKVTEGVFISKLFLEYKTAQGFNKGLIDLATQPEIKFKHLVKNAEYYPSGTTINTTGLQIRGGFYREGRCTTTYLLDTKPQSLTYDAEDYPLYDHLDAFLNEGETFTEPNNAFKVTVVKVNTDQSLQVKIEAQ